MRPYIALTIAGSDSGGGAGIQADLKTFAVLEVHGLCAITSVTAQNTQGVLEISDLPGEFVGKQIDAIAKDFDVEWAKTGMVSNAEIIAAIREKIGEYEIKLVVDPVMVASSGSSLIDEDAVQELKELLIHAKLVTPNIEEARRLAGAKIESVDDMRVAAEEIAALGPENVLIKGGHLDAPEIHNLLLHGNKFTEFETSRIPVSDVHGTGCVFSAAITAELAKGNDLQSSVKKSGDFMVDAIRRGLEIGRGATTVNPLAGVWKVAQDGEEIEEVQRAARNLADSAEFGRLIPEVGVNIAMAPRDAQRIGEVVGLTGRIVKVEGRPYLSGIPAPGGSEHMANLVLTVMKHDPQIRSAMNVRFSERILDKCRDLGLEISTFDREEEPPDVKTMEWGTDKAIEDLGKIPDIMYDRGGVGKEPMIRILGARATEVSEIALRVTKELSK